jgi:hypothetical protein
MVAKLSTGEITEELHEPSRKVRSGHAGSKARAAKLSKEERVAIAKKAAAARWDSRKIDKADTEHNNS